MEKLWIDLKSNENNSYEILIGEGVLSRLGRYLNENEASAVITDQNVERLYGKALDHALKGHRVCKIVLPPGEESKTLATVEKILSRMLDFGLRRDSRVIALGGGVVGDIGGFSASIYMRGIPYIQVPTTLLAQVDSSVGGKTGVNTAGGKNTVGSFYQPRAVLIDPTVLNTLGKRELITGIGEVIKYGIIDDYDFLRYVNRNFQGMLALEPAVVNRVIKQCCSIKTRIVAGDEREKGLRKILNFGHTLGHALEVLTDYERYTHGEAVLIGMHYEAMMAKNQGFIEEEYFQEIAGLIKKTGISPEIKGITLPMLREAMERDKKNQGERISFVLPTGKGKVTEKLFFPDEISW